MLDVAPIGQRWMDGLASAVARASSRDQALAAAEQWARSLQNDKAFADLISQTAGKSYLAGQLMVRAVELADESGAAGTVALRGFTETARDDSASFLAMPFEQALAFFRDKQVISPAEFDALEDRFKTGGFVARQLASERLQQVAHDSIESLLAQGLTIPECVQAIRAAEVPEVRALGIDPASPSYLTNVIRTNVATAYGAGRFAAMNDPDVVALRPYRQNWTAGDTRVRPGHASLHGLVFDARGELAARYAPPLFFQCRCSQATLSERQFQERGLEVTTTRVDGIESEEFWHGTPALLSTSDA